MLKFLPQVESGLVNVYNPHDIYPYLSPDLFRQKRHIATAAKPTVLLSPSTGEISVPFASVPILYNKNMNFFMQGHTLSVFMIRLSAVGVMVLALCGAWKYSNLRGLLSKAKGVLGANH